MSEPRLHPSKLRGLPPAVRRPRLDRSALRPGIVHLGLGAFARAHLAVFNDDALDAGAAPDWGITGVSLRHADTRDALAPQEGLYTLALRDADEGGAVRQQLRVIGSLHDMLVAPEDPAAVLQRIAASQTRIVSLTVTEKGYCHAPAGPPQRRIAEGGARRAPDAPASGVLRLDDPDIVHDLEHPGAPRTAVGFIVHGLALRRARGLNGLTLMSLDNLPANGRVLRGLVLAFAEALEAPALVDWVDATCSFPCSMVDRIVPRSTDADRDRVAAALGVHDAWPVVAEPFIDWVLEDRFVAGRPDWPGVRLVATPADVAAWERLKLRMVNGAHSALAYLGVVAGWSTVDAAMAQPALAAFIDAMLREEVEPTLTGVVVPSNYRQRLLQRFANPALAHRCAQIAMDGSQKIPQRLLATVRDRLAAGASIDRLALALAAWLHFLRGQDEAGRPYPLDDPLAAALQVRWREAEALGSAQARAVQLIRFAPVFGDLVGDPRLAAALTPHLHSLRERGVVATLAA